MKRLLASMAALALLAPSALAQVKTSDITIKSGDEEIKAFLAVPEGKGPFPAVVVIQEWWGLNDWIQDNAKHFAAKGFVAIAPDLYRGKVTDDPKIAAQLRKGMPSDRALQDCKAAVTAVAVMPNVQKNKIGSIGWCMGGGWSIKLAEDQPKLAAFVVNYGSLPTDKALIAKINAPMLGNFGAEDKGIPPESVQAFEDAMKAAGKSTDIKIYGGAGHAFENPNNRDGYRPEATADAEKRVATFFRKNLH